MGKKLIIKGADFSVNGISEAIDLDITSLVDQSSSWKPMQVVRQYYVAATDTNATRCALLRLNIGELVPNLSIYSKLRIDIKAGYDYVLGIARENIDSTSSWNGLSGLRSSTPFTWTTDNQFVETHVSEMMYFTGNFRYDDNTTQFTATTKFSDIATIKLLI